MRSQICANGTEIEQLRSVQAALEIEAAQLRIKNDAYNEEVVHLNLRNEQLHSQINAELAKVMQLRGHIEQLRTFIDISHVKEYRSCSLIERFSLNFNGLNGQQHDREIGCIELCCEPIGNVPGVMMSGTAEETIESIKRKRDGIVAESKMFSILGESGVDDIREFTSKCAKCPNYMNSEWESTDGLIRFVNMNMYPAPCNCKCLYCVVHNSEWGILDAQSHKANYEKMFDAIDYAKKKGFIAPDAVWQIASGEVTINPYKHRMYDLISNNTARFLTNCFVFDERIEENLRSNPKSVINLSIDAGTPETWHKIKGVDNFETVKENLVKYFASSTHPGQITLKYIILPGLNDNYEDLGGVIELMRRLQVEELRISCDTRTKYSQDKEHRGTIIEAAGLLTAMLHRKGMAMSLALFFPEEYESIIAFSDELLRSNKV
jgi:wyosine [tRNA(Phe)-imidazoG37] synthetase (radical SAM superfamily)